MFNILTENSANFEVTDKDQKTPLHIASLNGKTDVVKYLVFKGANKNAKSNGDEAPFSVADNDENN